MISILFGLLVSIFAGNLLYHGFKQFISASLTVGSKYKKPYINKPKPTPPKPPKKPETPEQKNDDSKKQEMDDEIKKYNTRFNLNSNLHNYCPGTYNCNFRKLLYETENVNQSAGYTDNLWLDFTRKVINPKTPLPVDAKFMN